MPDSTARGAFPFPTASDADDVPADIRRLAERLAEAGALFSDVLIGDRPAASTANKGTLYRNPQTGLFSWSTGQEWVAVNPPRTTRFPHTFTASPDVLVPAGDQGVIPPFFVPVPAGQQVFVVGARHMLLSGTSATVTVQRNGQNVAGLANVNVSTTPTTTMLEERLALANLDRLAPVVTAVAGAPRVMTFSLLLDYVA